MTSFSLTFMTFKAALAFLQDVFAYLLSPFKRMRSYKDVQDDLRFVREQAKNEAHDLKHF